MTPAERNLLFGLARHMLQIAPPDIDRDIMALVEAVFREEVD